MSLRSVRAALAAATLVGTSVVIGVGSGTGVAHAATTYPLSYTEACPSADQVTPALNENLIANPGAEDYTAYPSAGDPSWAGLPDCWTVDSSIDPHDYSVLSSASYSGYAQLGGAESDTVPSGGGQRFFFGGDDSGGPAINTYAFQTIDLSSIGAAGQPFALTADLGGYSSQADYAEVIVSFEGSSGNVLSTATLQPVTPAQRGDITSLLPEGMKGTAPAGTTQAVVEIETTDTSGSNDDGSADNLNLTIGDHLQALPPPSPTAVPYSAPSAGGGLYDPTGVAATANGTVYVSNTKRNAVLKVTSSTTSVVAGSFLSSGESGDGGSATSATLYQPAGLALDQAGDLFIADAGDDVVREVTADGIIHRFAGNGKAGASGDGSAATAAELDDPQAVAVNASGDVFIADTNSNEVREVKPNGIIVDFAGTGKAGYYGDGGPATSAELDQPSGVAVDSEGNVYIADSANDVVRRVGTDGTITTVAGDYAADQSNDGVGGSSGDGGTATTAELHDPEGVALDPAGDLFIADTGNGVVREVTPAGIISTVVSNLSTPATVALDTSGATLYTTNTSASTVLQIAGYTTTSPAGPGPVGIEVAPALPESSHEAFLPIAAVAVLGGAGFIVARRQRRRAVRTA